MKKSSSGKLRVALSGTPWVANQIRETVEFACGSIFNWVDITALKTQGLGFGPFGKMLRVFEFANRVKGSDVLLQVYVDRHAAWKSMVANILGKKIILYWIGSDCYGLLKGVDRGVVLRASARADLNLGCGPSAMRELTELGIDAVEYITPPKLSTELARMPEQHAVLISVPDGREEFYGYTALRRLIDDFPEMTFHVVRSSKRELWEADNVVFWGVVSNEKMNEVFNQISIVVRFPEHDSTSMILMESAIKGKRIISKSPFPTAWVASDYEDLCSLLLRAINEPVIPHVKERNEALDLFDRRSGGERLAKIIMGIASPQGDEGVRESRGSE